MRQTVSAVFLLLSTYLDWIFLRCSTFAVKRLGPTKATSRLLIVPCDPWSVVGSRGDQAMILAAIHYYRSRYPKLDIDLITVPDFDEEKNKLPQGVNCLKIWEGRFLLHRLLHGAQPVPEHVVVLGADVMDGHYSPFVSLVLLTISDLFLRRGVDVHLLGFSFNASPSGWLRLAFDTVHPGLRINCRDEVSFQRLKKFTRHANIRLVADAAFCLQPNERFEQFADYQAWCAHRRREDRTILGLNLHNMLFIGSVNEPDRNREWLACVTVALKEFLQQEKNVDLVLIPHDFRPQTGDCLVLDSIFASLSCFDDRLYYLRDDLAANQIKSMVSLVDGLISCRMHLVIAALGQGIPVLGVTYQGKFEGLFRHFDLMGDKIFVDPVLIDSADKFLSYLDVFHQNLPSLRKRVERKLPKALALSKQNFQ